VTPPLVKCAPPRAAALQTDVVTGVAATVAGGCLGAVEVVMYPAVPLGQIAGLVIGPGAVGGAAGCDVTDPNRPRPGEQIFECRCKHLPIGHVRKLTAG
jgi:hypothetical protein